MFGIRATGEGFPSSPPPPMLTPEELLRARGVVVSEPNLGGVPLDEGAEEEERIAPMLTPGVRTGVVAGPARSSGWKAWAKVRLKPPGVRAVRN